MYISLLYYLIKAKLGLSCFKSNARPDRRLHRRHVTRLLTETEPPTEPSTLLFPSVSSGFQANTHIMATSYQGPPGFYLWIYSRKPSVSQNKED